MTRFIVSLIGGASLGGTYALIGLGLVLAFRATETFNFAHGELMLLPAFMVGYFQKQLHNNLPFGLQVIFSLLLVALVGVLFYVVVLRRTTGLPVFMGIIATLGLAAILDGAMTLVFGSNEYNITVPGLPHGSVSILGAKISTSSITLTIFTLVLAAIVASSLRFTHVGTKIRAAGQDPVLAAQGGINVRRVYMGSWAIAAILAGIAGISYGAVSIVDTSVVQLALAAIPAIMLGGLDSIEGAVVGGIIIGIIQGFTATYLGGQYLDVVTYTLLLVILLVRPQGMFGTQQVTRV
jgi:branched-chain amino acid transport system permease protein